MTMALEDIRVLDLSGVGAYASMIFADFGADVIRVAPVASALANPRQTHGSRWAPGGDPAPERSAAFNALHRGQRSIALNLKDADAREILHRLARDTDVVIESFRPGVADRLGAGYDTLSQVNARLVYCSLSGFGQNGPYRDMPGHDINYIALGGALGVTRRPGGPPTMPLNLLADFGGGALYAATAILIALHARQLTGKGQFIDMAMSDGVLSLLTAAFISYFNDGDEIRPGEYLLNGGKPFYDVYECSDGRWLALGCVEPHFYSAMCEAFGLEEFLDRQFDENSYPELRRRLTELVASRSQDDWMLALLGTEVCAAPVTEIADIPRHPHIRARNMIAEIDSSAGRVRQVGVAPKLSETPGRIRHTGPRPGEHTSQILGEMGYGGEAIAGLAARGAIADPAVPNTTETNTTTGTE